MTDPRISYRPDPTSTRTRTATTLLLALAALGMTGPAGAQQGADDEPARDEFERACMMPADSMMDMMEDMTPESMMRMCMMPMPPGMANASAEEHEKMFLMRMVMHHRSAIMMADLAPERATHEELKALARNISAAQQAEIDDMTRWLRDWHNATPPSDTMMDRMMDMQVASMANMSGAEFERAFLDHMIMHHELAIDMAKPMMERMPHNASRDAAAGVVTTQQAEIDSIRAWRSAWYPDDSTPTPASPAESAEDRRGTPAAPVAFIVIALTAAALIVRGRR